MTVDVEAARLIEDLVVAVRGRLDYPVAFSYVAAVEALDALALRAHEGRRCADRVEALTEALYALIDVQPYLMPIRTHPQAREHQEAALDLAAAALAAGKTT